MYIVYAITEYEKYLKMHYRPCFAIARSFYKKAAYPTTFLVYIVRLNLTVLYKRILHYYWKMQTPKGIICWQSKKIWNKLSPLIEDDSHKTFSNCVSKQNFWYQYCYLCWISDKMKGKNTQFLLERKGAIRFSTLIKNINSILFHQQ